MWSSVILFLYTIMCEILLDNGKKNDLNIFYKIMAVVVTCISGPLCLPDVMRYDDIQPQDILLAVIYHIILTDVIFYHIHYLFHRVKFLYNNFHIVHHTPKNMTSSIGTYEHPVETLVARAIPFVIWTSLLTSITDNYITWFISTITVIYITIIGHAGYKPTYKSILLCPWILILKFIPESQNGLEHEMHHKYYNCNYSSFLRIWDDYYSTAGHYDRKKTNIISFIYNILYITLIILFPVESLILYIMYNIHGIAHAKLINYNYHPNMIYGYHPHGILSLPAFIAFAWSDLGIPFAVRDSLIWISGTCSVSKESIISQDSVAIALDGRIGDKIIKRTGFCKLGKNLCPCYCIPGTYDIVCGDLIQYTDNTEQLSYDYYTALEELMC